MVLHKYTEFNLIDGNKVFLPHLVAEVIYDWVITGSGPRSAVQLLLVKIKHETHLDSRLSPVAPVRLIKGFSIFTHSVFEQNQFTECKPSYYYRLNVW